jgi:hypothetical protein
MPFPFAAVGAGLNVVNIGLQLAGNSAAKKARRREAEAQRARLEAEAKEIERQTKRQVSLFKKRGEITLGEQASSFAASGVDISSSPLLVAANTKADIKREAGEIERQGRENARLTRLGARQVTANANALNRASDFGTGAEITRSVANIFKGFDRGK